VSTDVDERQRRLPDPTGRQRHAGELLPGHPSPRLRRGHQRQSSPVSGRRRYDIRLRAGGGRSPISASGGRGRRRAAERRAPVLAGAEERDRDTGPIPSGTVAASRRTLSRTGRPSGPRNHIEVRADVDGGGRRIATEVSDVGRQCAGRHVSMKYFKLEWFNCLLPLQ